MSPASYRKKVHPGLWLHFHIWCNHHRNESFPSRPFKADMSNGPCVTIICPTMLLQGERKEARHWGSGPQSLQPISLPSKDPGFSFSSLSQFRGVEYALGMSGLRERNAVTMCSTRILAYLSFSLQIRYFDFAVSIVNINYVPMILKFQHKV